MFAIAYNGFWNVQICAHENIQSPICMIYKHKHHHIIIIIIMWNMSCRVNSRCCLWIWMIYTYIYICNSIHIPAAASELSRLWFVNQIVPLILSTRTHSIYIHFPRILTILCVSILHLKYDCVAIKLKTKWSIQNEKMQFIELRNSR